MADERVDVTEHRNTEEGERRALAAVVEDPEHMHVALVDRIADQHLGMRRRADDDDVRGQPTVGAPTMHEHPPHLVQGRETPAAQQRPHGEHLDAQARRADELVYAGGDRERDDRRQHRARQVDEPQLAVAELIQAEPAQQADQGRGADHEREQLAQARVEQRGGEYLAHRGDRDRDDEGDIDGAERMSGESAAVSLAEAVHVRWPQGTATRCRGSGGRPGRGWGRVRRCHQFRTALRHHLTTLGVYRANHYPQP